MSTHKNSELCSIVAEIGSLLALDPAGITMARAIRDQLRADAQRLESCLPMELAPQPRKGIVSSRSFGRQVFTRDEVEQSAVD